MPKPPKKDEKKKDESLQDWITDTAKKINKGREDLARGAYNTSVAISKAPSKAVKNIGAAKGIGQNIATIGATVIKKGGDKVVKNAGAYPGIAQNLVKIATRKRPSKSAGATGGSGGGSTKRIPSPAKPKIRPTRGNVRKIK